MAEGVDGKRGEGSWDGPIVVEVPQKAKGLYTDFKEGRALQQLSHGLLQSGAPRTKSRKPLRERAWVTVENFSHKREDEKKIIIRDGNSS